jgi:hypothetical protein
LDDDFGFSEYRYNFDGDGKIYSSTKGIDLWVLKILIKL